MSKGPDWIERAISAILNAEPDNAFTTEELCERVICGASVIEKKHRILVIPASKRLNSRRVEVGLIQGDGVGGQSVIYRRDNVNSYALARLRRTVHCLPQQKPLSVGAFVTKPSCVRCAQLWC